MSALVAFKGQAEPVRKMALERPHPIFSKLRATFGTKLYFLLALLVEQNSRDSFFPRHLGTLAAKELRNGDYFL